MLGCFTFIFGQTWMYLAVPTILYACERLIRLFRSGSKAVTILKVYLSIYIVVGFLIISQVSSLINSSETGCCISRKCTFTLHVKT